MNKPANPPQGARSGAALETLVLRLAGVTLSLRSDSADWIALVRAAWGHHTAPPDAAGTSFEIRYHLVSEPCRDFDPPRLDPGAAYRRSVTPDGFSLHAAHFRADVDLDRRQARAAGPPDLSSLHLLLHNLLPALIPDGLLIHGVGLAAAGRAWICAGPSGCGKSTLAGLFPDAVLADELLAVRRVHGAFAVEGLPFPASRADAVPLAGIHFIRHGDTTTRTRMAQSAALRELARAAFWPVYSVPAMHASFAMLAELSVAVPCFDLAFLPGAGVWPVITGDGAVG